MNQYLSNRVLTGISNGLRASYSTQEVGVVMLVVVERVISNKRMKRTKWVRGGKWRRRGKKWRNNKWRWWLDFCQTFTTNTMDFNYFNLLSSLLIIFSFEKFVCFVYFTNNSIDKRNLDMSHILYLVHEHVQIPKTS